jgi:membrane fusion protein (multidrug efflux system)
MKKILVTAVLLSIFSISAHAFDMSKMPPTPVEVATVQKQAWQPELHATGTLVANRGVMLRTEITGRITKVLFTPGQLVKPDAPLIQLNPDILQAQFDSAKAQQTLSQAHNDRMLALYKRNTISKADLDKSQATLKSDTANVAHMQARLDQALIKAPFEGRVGLNLVHPGDYVASGQELVSIQAIDPIRADFSVPETYAGKVVVGQMVQVTTALYSGKFFTGKLAEIDSLLSSKTRTLAVRAHIPNADHKLLPGAFVDVKLFLGEKQDVLTVPQTAVVFDASGNYVYKLLDKKAIKTPVKLDTRLGERVIIKEGLKVGDIVIIAGQVKLHDGSSVDVKAAKKA